jgi:hypothetical protein
MALLFNKDVSPARYAGCGDPLSFFLRKERGERNALSGVAIY